MEEKIIEWYSSEEETDGNLLIINHAQCKEKTLVLLLEFEGQVQARLRATITSKLDKAQDIEYFWQRYYVGTGKEFENKMYDRLLFKQAELGNIAMEMDLK